MPITSQVDLEFSQIQELTVFDMQFFVILMETHCLTTTSRRMNISISKASRLLKKMRTILRDPIVLRSTPKMICTSKAYEIEIQLRKILNSINQLTQDENFDPKTITRVIRIGAVDNAIFSVLNDLWGEIEKAAPNVLIEITPYNNQLFESLSQGYLDLAISPSTLPLPLGMKYMKLYDVEYALCTRKHHPLALYFQKHQYIPLKELKKYKKIQITYRPINEPFAYKLDESHILGKEIQPIGIRVPYFLNVPSLLKQTNFTAVLPLDTAQLINDQLAEPLFVIPFPHGRNNKEIRKSYYTRLVWHERNAHDLTLQWLRSLIYDRVLKKTLL